MLQRLKKRDNVERALSKELKNHSCPICYDTMIEPQILFPCGHTFCSQCMVRHRKTNGGGKCPYCRATITSVAPNHSLKQLIEVYASSERRDVPSRSLEKQGTCSRGAIRMRCRLHQHGAFPQHARPDFGE